MKDIVLLVEPLIPALRRYARALVRETSAADDLVQDCMERAVSNWDRRRKLEDTRSWIFAILHNLAISRLRQLRRRGPHVPIEAADEASLSHAGSHEDALRLRDLLAALDKLPEEQRAVMLLICVEDLSYLEAAAVLNVPLGTIMSRLARGRERLRQSLDPGQQPIQKAGPPNLRSVK